MGVRIVIFHRAGASTGGNACRDFRLWAHREWVRVGNRLPAIPDEMLVMHGFTGAGSMSFYLGCESRECRKVERQKAVVTESNAGWTLSSV